MLLSDSLNGVSSLRYCVIEATTCENRYFMRIRNGTLAPQQIMIQRTEHTMTSLSLQSLKIV